MRRQRSISEAGAAHQTSCSGSIETFVRLNFLDCLKKLADSLDGEDKASKLELINAGEMLRGVDCIIKMQNITDSKLIAAMGDFSKYFNDFTSSVLKPAVDGKLEAEKSQAALQEWQQKSANIMSFAKIPAGPMLPELQSTMKALSEKVENTLQGQVNTEAVTAAKACLGVASKVIGKESANSLTDDEMKNFQSQVEKAKLMSSVLGNDGQSLRDGLAVIEAALMYNHMFGGDLSPESLSKFDFDSLTVEELNSKLAAQRQVQCLKLESAEQSLVSMCKLIQGEESQVEPIVTGALERVTACRGHMARFVECLRSQYTKITRDPQSLSKKINVPEEFTKIESISDVLKFKDLVASTFTAAAAEEVSKATRQLDECLGSVKDVSSRMGVKEADLCDVAKCTAARHMLLSWMSLACISVETSYQSSQVNCWKQTTN